jgi:menaquinone-9 beta-reductase
VSWSFADWLGELAALRARRAHPGHTAVAGAVFASLLEFPARIGGWLGGATRRDRSSPPVRRAVR